MPIYPTVCVNELQNGATIVTETKNEFLISADISLAYYVDSRYIRFIKLSITHKRLRNCETFSDFRKKEETSTKS